MQQSLACALPCRFLFLASPPPPHKKFSKIISLNVKNLESVLLAEPYVDVMFSCRTLTCSAKVCCRTLQIAVPKALHVEKDYPAEPANVGSFLEITRKYGQKGLDALPSLGLSGLLPSLKVFKGFSFIGPMP